MIINYKTCPGCGRKLPDQNLEASDQYNALGECEKLYHELSAYLIMNPDITFRLYVGTVLMCLSVRRKNRPLASPTLGTPQ